jgi:hypothetical protein
MNEFHGTNEQFKKEFEAVNKFGKESLELLLEIVCKATNSVFGFLKLAAQKFYKFLLLNQKNGQFNRFIASLRGVPYNLIICDAYTC